MLVVLVGLCSACSVGHGSGEATGEIRIADCTGKVAYSLRPTFFSAQPIEELLQIRVQRGGDLEKFSDGIHLLVHDAEAVKRTLNTGASVVLPVVETPPDLQELKHVDVSLFLNDTCERERSINTVALSAVSGSVTFNEIYAPRVNPNEVQIDFEMNNLRFESREDPDESWATIDGAVSFLYTRGQPAQPFP